MKAAGKVKLNSKVLKQILSMTSAEAFAHVYSDRYREIGKAFGLVVEQGFLSYWRYFADTFMKRLAAL